MPAKKWLNTATDESSLDKAQAFALMLFALLVIFARAPRLLLEGRVWAEEGTTYLRFAWNARAWLALVAPHQGYYSLLDNGMALVAARLLPLSAAALLFTWAALGIQMLTCYMVVACPLARSLAARFIALLALLLASASLSVWLSMENAQFFLPVCCAMLLISKSPRYPVAKLALLLGAGLTGVTSCALLPLFWVKAIALRSKAAVWQAIGLSSVAVIQAAVVLHSLHAGYRQPAQSNAAYLGPVLLQRLFLLPFFTNHAVVVSNAFFLAHHGTLSVVLLWLLFFVLLVFLMVLVSRAHWALAVLVAAGTLSAVFNWNGCFQCDDRLFQQSAMAGTRYFFPANVLFSVALAIGIFQAKPKTTRAAISGLLGLALISGGIQYGRSRTFLTGYEAWAPQVARWKLHPDQPIHVAPIWWDQPLMLPAARPHLALAAGVYDSVRAAQATHEAQQ